MSRDRSLDDFLDTGGGSDEGSAPDANDPGSDEAETEDPGSDETANATVTAGDESTAAGDDVDAVEPASPTSDWTTGGGACDVCEAAVERRWFDGDDAVCADCKEW